MEQCNTDVRSRKYFCSEKLVIIAYYECVFVVLGIQHAKCISHIDICDLSGFTIFLHFIS